MVRITKVGGISKVVANSAYENYYKSSGWMKEGSDVVSDEVSDDEWEDIADEEMEKPLSEMDLDELRQKAESLGISLAGLNTPKQIRDKIRKITT